MMKIRVNSIHGSHTLITENLFRVFSSQKVFTCLHLWCGRIIFVESRVESLTRVTPSLVFACATLAAMWFWEHGTSFLLVVQHTLLTRICLNLQINDSTTRAVVFHFDSMSPDTMPSERLLMS